MKKNVLRILSLMLVFALLIVSFASCKKEEAEESTSDESIEDNQSVDDPSEGGSVDETADTNDSSGESDTVDGTEAPTEPKTDDSGKPNTKAEILAAYTKVMDKAKASKPAYKKKEFQTIPSNSPERVVAKGSAAVSIIMGIAKQTFKTEDEAKVEEKEKNSDMAWFPVMKNEKGNYLTDLDFIKEAKSEKLSNGNIKLTIVLKDEVDSQPTPDNSGKPLSKVGAMFYPLPMQDILDALNDPTVSKVLDMENFTINYHDSTAVLEYNPANDQLISLMHQIVGGLNAKGKVKIPPISFEFFQNIYSTINIWDVVY